MSINLQIAVARAKMLAKRHFHSAVDVLYAALLAAGMTVAKAADVAIAAVAKFHAARVAA